MERPDLLPRSARQSHVCAFLKERRMKSANAIKTYRKSGVAEGYGCAIRVPHIYRSTTTPPCRPADPSWKMFSTMGDTSH